MDRRLKGLLLVFGLAIVFGVVSGGNVYARYDENDVSGDSCFKFYYSEDKGKKGLSTNEVCQDSSGKLSVTSSTTSPRFTVSGDEVCLTIPGKVDSCKTLIKSADGTRKFNEAFINSVIEEACGSTKTCKWTGSDRKTHTYYVSVNEPVNTSNSGGSSGSSGSGGGSSGGSEDEDVVPDEDEPTCMNSGAAQSLGWIVCPVLNLLSNAAEEAYTDYVEPALRVEPTLFSQNENDGTRQAWGVFQGFANILFIILLLVVIFSQLTGVGIDNYGIKKILPKLIVAAVLINLSYLICLIFIDLSNIVGNGIKSIFDGLSTGQLPQSIEIGGGENKGEIVLDKLETSGKTALTGVVILVAVVAQIWSAVAAEGILGGIILPLVLAAISVVIAIFFLFLLLATRQAAVVALTVISPLAFACYILPNTKRLFDKWVKLGWALVLVYPICGLLVGGGDYVSRLLLSAGAGSGGFAMAFMAMIVGVVPIFFIPSVLKSSLAAAGNIGAKISSIGSRVRGGAARGIKGNELYKRAQERGRENAARSFAGFNRDGSQRKVGRIGRLLRGGERGMARARAQYLKDQDARNREKSLLGVGYDAAAIGLKKKAEKDETADYMTLINNETRNGEDTDRLYQMFDRYMDDGNKAGAVAVARIAGRRKDTADDFLSKKITGQSINKDTGEETLSNASSKYNRKALSSVMKEIATGENSGAYRSAAPMGFEFAADFNRNYREDENGNPTEGAGESNYEAWRNKSNVSRSMSNYVTNSRELIDVKNSSLREMNRLLNTPGAMDEGEVTRLRDLARDTIKNKNSGQLAAAWDTTKEENIYKMAYGGEWERRLGEDRKVSGERISDATGSSSVERSSSGGGGLTEPLTPIADSGRSGAFSSEGEFRVRDIGDRLSSESRDSLVGGTGRTDGAGGARSSGESSRQSGGTPSDYAPGDPSSAGGE